eukprot:scaffold213_cov245-Pinguiococcus_pyrenoidosus.AAC.25
MAACPLGGGAAEKPRGFRSRRICGGVLDAAVRRTHIHHGITAKIGATRAQMGCRRARLRAACGPREAGTLRVLARYPAGTP